MLYAICMELRRQVPVEGRMRKPDNKYFVEVRCLQLSVRDRERLSSGGMRPDPDDRGGNADCRCIRFGDFMLPGAAVRVAEDWMVAGRTTRHLPIREDPCIAAQ